MFKNPNKPHSKTNNTLQLIKSEEIKNAYQQQLHENLCKRKCTSWEHSLASITDAATKTIDFTQNSKNHQRHNPVVERLSNQQKEFSLRISSTVNNENAKELKTQRNRILHDIANIFSQDKNRKLDNLVSAIDKCHKTYQTTKFINKKPLQNLIVHDKAGRNVTEPNAICSIIGDHFKAHFKDPNELKLEPFIGNPRPLDTPISKDKVAKNIHKLQKKKVLDMIKYHLNS